MDNSQDMMQAATHQSTVVIAVRRLGGEIRHGSGDACDARLGGGKPGQGGPALHQLGYSVGFAQVRAELMCCAAAASNTSSCNIEGENATRLEQGGMPLSLGNSWRMVIFSASLTRGRKKLRPRID
jgi:hypothetical protein